MSFCHKNLVGLSGNDELLAQKSKGLRSQSQSENDELLALKWQGLSENDELLWHKSQGLSEND